MRVIIPAAGRGTRMHGLTNCSPKCLLDINGRPLLYYLLANLKKLKVSEVIIVTGYLSGMIEDFVSNNPDFPNVQCIYNNRYETTNNIVSISLTRDFWDEDFCIIDSDLLVKLELLEKLTLSDDTCLIIDNSKPLSEIAMKARAEDGWFIHLEREVLGESTLGEFFGLSRWTTKSAEVLQQSIDNLLIRGETNVWYEWAIRDMLKFFHIPIVTCSSDMWVEIDNTEDYTKARSFIISNIAGS